MQPIFSPSTLTGHHSRSVSALLWWITLWVALLSVGTPGAEASSKHAAISELLELAESFSDTFMASAMLAMEQDDLDSVGDSGEVMVAFDTPPDAIHVEPADYPESARQASAEGEVTVLVTIDTDGRVTDVDAHESDAVPALERAAINAAYKWRFKPAKQKGTPVKVRILIPFRFSLE